MIVLDTNVVSALMRQPAESVVVEWANRQPLESIWTTAVTVFEIEFGLHSLPWERRRRQLEAEFARVLDEDFEGRILPLDIAAASEAARLAAICRRAGRPVEIRDAQIAGIVMARRSVLATRNVRDFEALDIPLVDPWTA